MNFSFYFHRSLSRLHEEATHNLHIWQVIFIPMLLSYLTVVDILLTTFNTTALRVSFKFPISSHFFTSLVATRQYHRIHSNDHRFHQRMISVAIVTARLRKKMAPERWAHGAAVTAFPVSCCDAATKDDIAQTRPLAMSIPQPIGLTFPSFSAFLIENIQRLRTA